VSEYHFVRCFEATYGETPIRYLTRRRVERAQDLLRAANLTVTEVCMLVGFSSLGSFSRSWWARARPPTATAGPRAAAPTCPAATCSCAAASIPRARQERDLGEDHHRRRAVRLTVCHADHPELQVTLMKPGSPLDVDAADFVRRQLGKGQMGGLGLRVDDCRKTYDELSAAGVEFLQEPADRPYGVEAVMRDISSSWLVLVEPREYASDGPTA